MKKLLIAACVLAVLFVIAAAPKEEKRVGVLAPLEKGQTVGVKEEAACYKITVMPGVDLAHKVVEVGPDFVVVVDAANLTETRIPITSIKSVTITRPPKK